jgi:uncharacterized protein (TIGR01440 family)
MQNELFQQAKQAAQELVAAANLKKGDILVVGCSSSEVAGGVIGHNSSLETAEAVFGGIYEVLQEKGIYLAAQCCEHLNRAIVMEESVLRARCLMQVNAVPQPKAGGSVPAAAWKRLQKPALAAFIQAEAAIDIGDTLVGMHIRPVAVPLRIDTDKVGHANLVMAYSRLPYIGGSRAVYE